MIGILLNKRKKYICVLKSYCYFVILAAIINFLSFGDAKGEGCVYSQFVKALDEASPRSGHFTFMSNIKPISISTQDEICLLYSIGKTTREISKIFVIDRRRISSVLRANKIHIRTNYETKRIHKFNYAYFDDIDNQEKAYFLGFLFADGHARSDGYGIKMNLAESDASILETFRTLIESEKPLRKITINIPNRQNQYCLDLNSKSFSEKMATLGVVKAKTHKLTFPTYLKQEMVRHFIRGYFDGDGSICVNKANKTCVASIAGTFDFCSSVQKIIKQKISINGHMGQPNKERQNNIRIVSWGGRNSINGIYDFLYRDATIFLERKKNKFIEASKFAGRAIRHCSLCDNKYYAKGFCKNHYYSNVIKVKRGEALAI